MHALGRTDGPTALALTRQKLPQLPGTRVGKGSERGGYIIDKESGGDPEIILIATGSEVALALEAAKILRQRPTRVRVVSLPCWKVFDKQPRAYRDSVLPPPITARLAIEGASPMGWERYVGNVGKVVGIDRFGASAPYKILTEKFGYTAENIAREGGKLL